MLGLNLIQTVLHFNSISKGYFEKNRVFNQRMTQNNINTKHAKGEKVTFTF